MSVRRRATCVAAAMLALTMSGLSPGSTAIGSPPGGQPGMVGGEPKSAIGVRPAPPGYGSPNPVEPDTRVYTANTLTDVDAVTADDAWAVGNDVSGMALMEHWDGHAWHRSPGPADLHDGVYLNSVDAVAGNDVWAVGDRFIDGGRYIHNVALHWDGVTWTVVHTPQFGLRSTLASVSGTGPDDVWAVGAFTAKQDRTLALHWDGSSWRRFVTPNPGGRFSTWLYGVTSLTPDDVWAVGAYDFSQFGRNHTLAEHWDGTRWTREHMTNPGSKFGDALYGVSGTSEDRLIAVGVHEIKGSSYDRPLVERWDGTRWTHVLVRHCGRSLNWFYAVSSPDTGQAWAVGQKQFEAGPSFHTLTCSWDGTSWTPHKSRNPGHQDINGTSLLGVSMLSDETGWAVGFYSDSRTWLPFIEQWNGTRWIRQQVG